MPPKMRCPKHDAFGPFHHVGLGRGAECADRRSFPARTMSAVETLLRQGDQHAAAGDLAGALAAYETATKEHPGHADAWLRHGAALTELHRPGEALASYAMAENLAPSRPEI